MEWSSHSEALRVPSYLYSNAIRRLETQQEGVHVQKSIKGPTRSCVAADTMDKLILENVQEKLSFIFGSLLFLHCQRYWLQYTFSVVLHANY